MIISNVVMPSFRLEFRPQAKILLALEQACFKDPWDLLMIQSFLDNAHHYACVFEDLETAQEVGYFMAQSLPPELELLRIGVKPTHQGLGLGKTLLLHLDDYALQHNIEKQFLEVASGNLPALYLYAGAGFEEISRRKGYYRLSQEDALILQKSSNRSRGK